MANATGVRSVGRFLYTQNPFYLLSCFLVIYGLQVATLSNGDLYSRSLVLAGGIGLYTLLMAITSVGVIRLGKVWEDGRSIVLVVVISLIAWSSSLDELCLTDPSTALWLSIVGMIAGVVCTEVVLFGCQIAFPFWYRASYYAMLLVFFTAPIVLGRAVAERYDQLANWGSVLFSCGIAVAMLFLIPAVRRGRSGLRSNLTPWRWPLYPLSVFVVVLVLAGIRAHAIWMSFGFFGESLGFEPFLLLPMVLALLVLLVEADVHRRRSVLSVATMYLAPMMLLCGLNRNGLTLLPVADDIRLFAGSATTVCWLTLAGFYIYACLRRVRHSEQPLVASLVAVGFFAEIPKPLLNAGFQPWVFVLLAALVYLFLAIRVWTSDLRWFAFAGLIAAALVLAGQSFDRQILAITIAGGWMVVAMMAIGYLFDTRFAKWLRYNAAGALTLLPCCLVAWHFERATDNRAVLALIGVAGVTFGYFWLTRRFAWSYVFALQMLCLAGVGVTRLYQHGSLTETSLPLPLGVGCFAIGIVITVVKSGAHQRWWPSAPDDGRWCGFVWGL